MLIIYTIPPSLYCSKLRIVLRHKQLPFEERLPPGGYGSDEYKRIVASGNLPALVDGDLLLADSEAIAEYLNEKYPTPAMLPTELATRARIRERGRFHDTRLEPALRALFTQLAPSTRDDKFVQAQSRQLNERLIQLGELLQLPHANRFSELSLADCGFAVTFTWIDVLIPALDLRIDWPATVAGERERLADFDAVANELVSYKPIITDYVKTTIAGQ